MPDKCCSEKIKAVAGGVGGDIELTKCGGCGKVYDWDDRLGTYVLWSDAD